ncbi:MAG: hypothetical protein DDT42_01539 [candidate division WS2 bacterium]|uniref:Uncharacterized protein n=1 Tax=Psychracetigena formicireducens TaxID=2986056 RepID=A0A9E2F1P3_PSYF1|nr:hypothetical protein [Candidatus Psychracetigena formicireducens]
MEGNPYFYPPKNHHYTAADMRYFHYLLYAFGGLGLAACSSQSSSLEEGEAAEAEEVKFNAQQEQTTVQLYVATRKPFEYQIQVNGKVEAGQQA